MTLAAAALPQLRIYRNLDPKKLTAEFAEHLRDYEGNDNPTFVDGDRVRDYVWSDEIVHATKSYSLVDATGREIAKFDTLDKAEAAAKSAKFTFDVAVSLDPDEDEDEDGE